MPRSNRRRLALALLVLVVLIGAGWVAANGFRQTLFGTDGEPQTPAQILAALNSGRGEFATEPGSAAAIGSFGGRRGEITLYMARMAVNYQGSPGVEWVYSDEAGKVVSAESSWWAPGSGEKGKSLFLVSGAPENVSGAGGIWQLSGIAPDGTSTLKIEFRDGTSEAVPVHKGLFAYWVGGSGCAAERLPNRLVALDSAGAILDSSETGVPAGCANDYQGFEFHPFSTNEKHSIPSDTGAIFAIGGEHFNRQTHEFDGRKQLYDLRTIQAIGELNSTRGMVGIYMARTLEGTGVGLAYTVKDAVSLWGFTWDEATGTQRLFVKSQSASHHGFGAVDEWVIFGIAPAAAERLELIRSDGESLEIPLHGGLFAYIFGGNQCSRFYRPSELAALDAAGRVIDRVRLTVPIGCAERAR